MDTGMTSVRATIAICTLNRKSDLLRTMKGLEGQRCGSAWELLVVDNGSLDGSFQAADRFARKTPLCVRVVQEPTRGVSHARNRALREAEGEVLVFVDDDMDCDPGLLQAHLEAFVDPSVLATGGRILPRLPDNAPEWLRASLEEQIGGPLGRYDFGDQAAEIFPRGRIPLPFSGNLALRRRVALEMGGFRTDLGWTEDGRRIGGEDMELMKRFRCRGGKIIYLPDALVIHRVQPERATLTYCRVWHFGQGRASILMRGRPGPLMAVLKVIEQLFRLLRYSILPWSLLRDSKAKRLRKRWQAVGRLLELVRVPWEPGGREKRA